MNLKFWQKDKTMSKNRKSSQKQSINARSAVFKYFFVLFISTMISSPMLAGIFAPTKKNGKIVLFDADCDNIKNITNYTKSWIKGSDITPSTTIKEKNGSKWANFTYTGKSGVGVSRFDIKKNALPELGKKEKFTGISLLIDNKSPESKTVQLLIVFDDQTSITKNLNLENGIKKYDASNGFRKAKTAPDWTKTKFIWLASKNPKLTFSLQKISMTKKLYKNINKALWNEMPLKLNTDLSNDFLVSFVPLLLKNSTIFSAKKTSKNKPVAFNCNLTEDVILFALTENGVPPQIGAKSKAYIELLLKNRQTGENTQLKLEGAYVKKGEINFDITPSPKSQICPFVVIKSQQDFNNELCELNGAQKVVIPKHFNDNMIFDGKLDAGEWDSSQKIQLYLPVSGQDIASEKLPKEKTDIYISRKGNSLRFGIRCAKINGKKPLTNFNETGKRLWQDECIEFYFSPDRFSKKIAQIIVNSKGVFEIVNKNDSIQENVMPEIKTTVFPDKWELEAEIPVSQLLNQKCDTLAFNITRTSYDVDGKLKERSGWSTVKWNDRLNYGLAALQVDKQKGDSDVISALNNKCILIVEKKSKQQLKWETCVKSSLREHPAFVYPVVNEKLPNVLIVGDSVSMQYTPCVQKQLAGKANVFRIPGNGGPVARGLSSFDRWIGKDKWDIIIFNFGLHDSKYQGWDRANKVKYSSPEKYREELDQMVKKLIKTNAKLIWVSTTPIPEGAKTNDKGASIVFNKAAEEIMKKNNIPIIDLYSLTLPQIGTLLQPRNIHLSNKGAQLAGRKVAAVIEKYLKEKQ